MTDTEYQVSDEKLSQEGQPTVMAKYNIDIDTSLPRYNPRENTFRVDGIVDWEGTKVWGVTHLSNIHDEVMCATRAHCPVHEPSPHHMLDWEVIWDQLRTRMFRLCPEHSWPHPDPDDVLYLRSRGHDFPEEHVCVCYCCALPD